MSVTSESPLTNKALLLFRIGLQEQQSELTRAIDKIHKEILALADFEPGDVIDSSCVQSSKEAMFATYSQNRARLRRVEAALERIDASDFGVCTSCGGAIGLKRLEALPWATNCVKCQEQSEQGRVQ